MRRSQRNNKKEEPARSDSKDVICMEIDNIIGKIIKGGLILK